MALGQVPGAPMLHARLFLHANKATLSRISWSAVVLQVLKGLTCSLHNACSLALLSTMSALFCLEGCVLLSSPVPRPHVLGEVRRVSLHKQVSSCVVTGACTIRRVSYT